MQIEFKDKELEQIYTFGVSNKYNQDIIRGYIKKITLIKNASDERDFKNITSLHFEKLYQYPKGEYSVRINNQYRIIFNINKDKSIKIIEITELSKHYQ